MNHSLYGSTSCCISHGPSQQETAILQMSGGDAKLVQLPIVMAPIHSSLFVLPNFSDIFPLLPTDIDHILQRKVFYFVITVVFVQLLSFYPVVFALCHTYFIMSSNLKENIINCWSRCAVKHNLETC